MSKARYLKKGFTLYELVIVIFLVLMIGGLVVSFCVYLSNYLRHAEEQNMTANEVSSVRTAIERWFSYYDTEEYEYNITECKTDYYKQNYSVVYTVEATDGQGNAYAVSIDSESDGNLYLYLPYPDDGGNKMKLQYIEKAEFGFLSESDVYSCNIGYSSNIFRFLLFSRV